MNDGWGEWRDDPELEGELREQFVEQIQLAFNRHVDQYLAAVFTDEFIATYTFFPSWTAFLSAALSERDAVRDAGAVDGRRHLANIPRIRQLEREGETAEAERLLRECAAIEERIRARVPLIYFHERLAMLLERQARFDEALAVCRRYVAVSDPTSGALTNERMTNRIDRLERKLNKSGK